MEEAKIRIKKGPRRDGQEKAQEKLPYRGSPDTPPEPPPHYPIITAHSPTCKAVT